jgi:uncharacterized Zn-binding protein involved in type VI secretion
MAIVCHGDPTTTRGKVVAFSATIHDNGRTVALLGDQATCGNCKGLWKIYGTGEGVEENGRVAAINGDRVLCPCGKNRAIASPDAGMFVYIDTGARNIVASNTTASTGAFFHDEQFALRDANGRILANTFYTIRFPSGALVHGVTDESGYTGRYTTDGAQRLAVYPGHRED